MDILLILECVENASGSSINNNRDSFVYILENESS